MNYLFKSLALSFKKIHFRHFTPLLIALVLIPFGQQCSEVKLEGVEKSISFASSSNKFLMLPPDEFKTSHKYIFLIDMSNSMISGPCPQDVNAGILFSIFPGFLTYDPNKKVGNPNDHRADGIDCQVNPLLSINWKNITTSNPNILATPPIYYQTPLGVDYEGNRLNMVRNWLLKLKKTATPETLNSAKVMLIPVSGGSSQKALNDKVINLVSSKSIYTFLSLNDDKVLKVLDLLLNEQKYNLDLIKNDDPFRYKSTTMGTSSAGTIIKDLYDVLYRDMFSQYKLGLLGDTEYDYIHLTDGVLSPTEKDFQSTLSFSTLCASCAASRQSCVNYCSKIVADMISAWGDPLDNAIESIDFNLGMLYTLPNYFGTGTIRFNFINLQKQRVIDLWPNQKVFFSELKPLLESRNRHMSVWETINSEPPFSLPGSNTDQISYKITDIFILNSNVRFNQNGVLDIDSDGDGLFDNEELELHTDPSIARTNGYCLDGFLKNSAFKARCEEMKASKSCDPNLDSDGDSLNECEEVLLGTDPFDFDTDNDGIPDYLEWLYGFNPLVNDANKDSNSDGIPNLVNFSRGLGPNLRLKEISPAFYSNYELNYLGKTRYEDDSFITYFLDSYQVVLSFIPSLKSMVVFDENQVPLFKSRNLVSTSGNVIRTAILPSAQLINYTKSENTNQIMALARMIDEKDPKKVYWRIFKQEIPLGVKIIQPELDLSSFKLLKVSDPN